MLSQELRPFTLEEMAGQEENKKIIKAIIKNPDKAPKCLIFAGKFGCGKTTLSRILARDLNGIKDRDFDLLSSQFYYEFDSTVIGNVETIRNMRDQFLVSYGDYYRVIVFDECLHGDSEILLEDGSYIPIKKIVNEEMRVSVMSYNTSTGKVEPKKVTGWFKNNPKVFYRVKTARSKKSIWVSDNHRFITSDGERTLKDLHIGDNLLMYRYNLSQDERQILLGTLMGDSWIDKAPRNSMCSSPRFTLRQGEEQLNWLKVKFNALSNLMSHDTGIVKDPNEKVYETSYEGSKDTYSATSLSMPCLREISDMFFDYPIKNKRVKRETLNQLGALGLAVWYMDDGSLSLSKHKRADGSITVSPCVSLHTECFTSSDNDIIVDYFIEEWGIQVKKYFYNNYYYLYMGSEDSKKFLSVVAPYFSDGVLEYKLGGLYTPGNLMKNIQKGEYGVCEDPIIDIELKVPYPEPAYDLEVEDNHNYFGGNLLVHNCHTVSNAAQNALLKVLEEAIGKVFFIMCTTEPNKLLPTIRSRSLELEFTTVPKEEIVKNITTVSEQRNINLSDEIKLIIADRSAGHMRNAHMLLDKYLLLGEEDFKDSVRSSITLFCKYLVACYLNDKDNVLKYINELMNIPKDDLQSDWNTVITESMRGYTGFEIRHQDIKTLIGVYKSDFNIVVNCFFSPWIKNAFQDMPYFQATFLNMYLLISQTVQGRKSTDSAKESTSQTPQVNNRVLVR